MKSFTGKEYLKIDIANSFGLDKKEWEERIDWFDQNEHRLFSLVNSAEEPPLFYAGVKVWEEVKQGIATGYPISLDATASGIQILALITGDRNAARLTNAIDSGTRLDAYTELYHLIQQALVDSGELAGTIERDPVKKAIMTSFYGSERIPKNVFGEGQALEIFMETMGTHAKGPWQLNQFLLQNWDPHAEVFEWVLPDNFHARIKVMGTETKSVHFMGTPYEITTKVNVAQPTGRSLSANLTHSLDALIVRELVSRCNYKKSVIFQAKEALEYHGRPVKMGNHTGMVIKLWNHYKNSGFLSTRILRYLTKDNVTLVDPEPIKELINELPKNPFQVLSVHDCFRVLPNYGNDLRKQYNLILSSIAKSDMLNFLLPQIMSNPPKAVKMDSSLWKDVKEANYALS